MCAVLLKLKMCPDLRIFSIESDSLKLRNPKKIVVNQSAMQWVHEKYSICSYNFCSWFVWQNRIYSIFYNVKYYWFRVQSIVYSSKYTVKIVMFTAAIQPSPPDRVIVLTSLMSLPWKKPPQYTQHHQLTTAAKYFKLFEIQICWLIYTEEVGCC